MNEIIIYQTSDNQTQIDVKFENETVWLSQAQLVQLYQTSKANVSEHIKHIFEEGELNKEAVVRNFRTTASDGKNYNVKHYNLDMIISLGYRIKSSIATSFRIWATQRLKEYLIKGLSINQKRLNELQQTVQLIQKTIDENTNLTEAKGLLEIIGQYTQNFVLLNQYTKKVA